MAPVDGATVFRNLFGLNFTASSRLLMTTFTFIRHCSIKLLLLLISASSCSASFGGFCKIICGAIGESDYHFRKL
jgi:hypothetical protein